MQNYWTCEVQATPRGIKTKLLGTEHLLLTELKLTAFEKKLLVDTCADSIEYGLHPGGTFPVVVSHFPDNLRIIGATFVTLKRQDTLRGCVGCTHAFRPLILDAAHHAFSASQKDSRFPPIRYEELNDLRISVSVLSEPERLNVSTEEELLEALTPGHDGLIIEDGNCRATFLPQVWMELHDKNDFIRLLKKKAGFHDQYWSDTIRAYRYRVTKIP